MTHAVAHDALDAAAWAEARGDDPSIAALVERGRRWLPDFEALLGDLFYAFY